MVKLAGLIEGMATALQVSAPRVRTAAAQLRKHKLITTGPRGPGAPEMSPADASNLLLALMYDDDLAGCHVSVANLRAASFEQSWQQPRGVDNRPVFELPPHRFFRDTEGNALTFGYVLDTMLDWFVRYGSVEEEVGEEGHNYYAINMTFSVSRPGHHCRIYLDAYDSFWDVIYRWVSPEEAAYYREPCEDPRFRTRFDALNGPYMTSTRTVGEDSFTLIADCLRGQPWDDREGETIPPYEGDGSEQANG